jgi:hypothetical protein
MWTVVMAKSPIDSVGIAVTTIGGVLVYAGIKGYSVLAVVQNLITGKPIAENVNVSNPLVKDTPIGTVAVPAEIPPRGGTPRAIGKTLAASMGWTGAEWNALETLWNNESGWNPRAKNPSSGAYGIPQALPHTKMPKMAWPESAGGSSDATTQIQWGLSYIKSRYGSPRMALAFWQRQSPHWY